MEGSMLTDYEARSRYLALALEARRVMDLLLVFVQTGDRATDFEPSLRAIIDALQSTDSAENLLASLQTRLQFRSYEQITTLDEMLGPDDRRLLAQKLEALITEGSSRADQQRSATETIHILYEVEGRSLHYFNEPSSSQLTTAFAI
jgi:hypothetical protein